MEKPHDFNKSNEVRDEEGYIIEQFRFDDKSQNDVLKVIKDAFIHNAEDVGGTIAFSEDTFQTIFGSPYIEKELNVRAIHKSTGKVVGFLGGIPRELVFKGQYYKFGVPSFAAVDLSHKKKGLATKMGIKLMNIAKELGYQGGIAFFEPEEFGKDASRKIIELTGLKSKRIFEVKQFIIRVFDVDEVASVNKLKWYERIGLKLLSKVPKAKALGQSEGEIKIYEKNKENIAKKLFELMEDHVLNNELAIKRKYDDFKWYLDRENVICVYHKNVSGDIDGFVVAWEFYLAGFGKSIPFGWMDLIHTYRLKLNTAKEMFNELCRAAKEKGWKGIQMPFLPYFDPKPLKKARFIFYPKKLYIDLYFLEDLEFPEHVESFFLDWR